MTYYIYHQDEAPEALLAKFPNHAKYGEDSKLFLFCESLEYVTGVPSASEDIDNLVETDADEDYMDKLADEATYTGTAEERIAARIAARQQARIDARVALRVKIRQLARQAARKEARFNARMGQKLYSDWVAEQEAP